jgi:hypothetical protein
MDFKCGTALASRHSKQVNATMPMLHVHPSHFSTQKIEQRSRPQPEAPMRSRRQRRARLSAALNAAAIFLSIAGIALILVIA